MKKKKHSALAWTIRILTGYEIAICSMILLLLVVFFSTLEQAEVGLYTVSQRYYDMSVVFVQPQLKGKLLPIILPGAYWICAVFTVNLIAGGIFRLVKTCWQGNPDKATVRKRLIKKSGVFISHMSMVMLMIAGAVDYHLSSMTMLAVKEGESNRVGSEANDIVVEVSRLKKGEKQEIFVIENKEIDDLIYQPKESHFTAQPASRSFSFANLPFEVKIERWYKNAVIKRADSGKKSNDGEIVDGLFIRPLKILTETEIERLQTYNQQQTNPRERVQDSNTAACYLTIVPKDGTAAQKIITYIGYQHPVSVNFNGTHYGFELTSHKRELPFNIALNEIEVQKYQGTMSARSYRSMVHYAGNDGVKRDAIIQMNEPLRQDGYTFYQARWIRAEDEEGRAAAFEKSKKEGSPVQLTDEQKRTSVFQVVSNPADKWPEYCIYVCAFALFGHFGVSLINFMLASFKRKEQVKKNKKTKNNEHKTA